MSTTALEAAKKVNRVYTDVYLKRRFADGTYETDWLDISRLVAGSGIDRVSYRLDSDDYDVGIFSASNLRMSFNNRTGAFNLPYDSRSLWSAFESRHLSKIKVECGYIDSSDDKITEIAFNGTLDDRTIRIGDDDIATATVLSLDSIFSSIVVTAGAITSSISASSALYILCYRGEVLEHITVDPGNINPGINVTIDSPTEFAGKKLDQVLNEIMLLTNSVMYVDSSANLIIKSRAHASTVSSVLYRNPESGDSTNVYSISDFNSGRHRVKNAWYWGSSALYATSEEHHLKRYGVTRKSISSDSITNNTVKQQILDGMLEEWQFPKMELSLETDYLGSTIGILDTVRLDVRPRVSGSAYPLADYAVADSDAAVDYASGLLIPDNLGFKVLGIEHDMRNLKTELKLREIGKTLTDGYLDMTITQTLSVTFTAESTKDVDTSAYGINAQRAMVELLDTGDDYASIELDVKRPSSGTIRLTTGVAITKTIRILVVEVQA
jgi:hypothetical protein